MTAHPVWLWLNLLSLDAPLVAVVWQAFLARCYPSTLLPAGRWVLGLTVWAIYLADRLVDVHHPPVADETTRHRFYRDHSTAAKVLLGLVLIADAVVAFAWLRPAVFANGLLVVAAVLCYLAIFPLWRIVGTKWKKRSAAVVFTVGVFLVAWTGSVHEWRTLTAPAIAFGALCLGNMVLVEKWEKAGSRSGPQSALWMLLLSVGCVVGAFLGDARWHLAIATSAAALALLDRFGSAFSRDARGVLADAVLLTPLVFGLGSLL